MTRSRSPEIDRERSAVVAFIGGMWLLLSTLAVLRYLRFDMTAFDAGIFDNVLWRLAHGYDDVTAITGSHHFSDHMSPLLLFAVPVYALVPQLGLPTLMAAQAASVTLVGLASWLLAEHVGLSSSGRRAVLLTATLGVGTFNAALIDVHEVGLALGPLAMTIVMAMRRAPLRSHWFWPLLAALARIDLAVSVLIAGILLRKERPDHARLSITIGSTAAGIMALWLLLNPWEGTSFGFHFGHLNVTSATELPGAILRDPMAAIEPLLDPTIYGTALIWLAGFMFLPPLRAVRWVLVATPTLLLPIAGSWQQADLSHLHYWHVLLPTLAIATAIGLTRLPGLKDKAFYVALVAVAATWVFMPLFKPSFGDNLDDERAIVAHIQDRPEASVAAYRTLVPHLSRRPIIMQLPTPFACPTIPVASFVAPEDPPELVALPSAVFENATTAAERAVASAVRSYYRREAAFGQLEVWVLAKPVPATAYDLACGPEPSENS